MSKNLVATERAKLGAFLKAKRIKAKLSQGEVAIKLGYSSPQFISNVERGMCKPTYVSLPAIAEIYNIPKAVLTQRMLKVEEACIKESMS